MLSEILAKRIRKFRIATGLSQEKFALTINMDRTYYSAIENGRHNISLKNIEKIANGLGVKISDLFKDIEGEIWVNKN